jgi:hypothetical protein
MRASIAGNMRQLERERAQRLAEVWEAVSGSRVVPADGVLTPELRERYNLAAASTEQAMSARKREVIASLVGGRARQLERQTSLQVAIGRLSPAVTYLRAAEALAGTGTAMRRRWREEVEGAQHALEAATFDRRFGVELFAADLDYERIIYWPDPHDASQRVPQYDELPAFAHHPLPLLGALAEAAPDLCLLSVECVGLMVVAALAYFRLDV